MKTSHIIYACHVLVVGTTAWIAYLGGLFEWYYLLAIVLPLLISGVQKLRYLSYTLNVRILFPVSVGLLCVAVFHYFPNSGLISNQSEALSALGVQSDLSRSNFDKALFEVNPIFKDAVSVLYAICAAFMLWKGLSDFDELKQVLYEEANEVGKLSDYLVYFDSEETGDKVLTDEIRSTFLQYLDNMLNGEQIVANEENEILLEKLTILTSKLRPKDFNDQIALEEIIKGVSRISVLRALRTVSIEKKMSPFIMALMLIMSLTIVSSFLGKATGTFNIDYFYVFLLPVFYTSIFMTLVDLSSPFDGYWRIKLGAITTVKDKIIRKMA